MVKCNFYLLRHGGERISLQYILGHKDPRTTDRYSHALMPGKRELVSGFQIGEKEGKLLDMPPNKKYSG